MNSALPVRWNKVQRHAPLRLKAVQRPQDGVMLHHRGHHMISFSKNTVKSQIQRIRAIRCEYYFLGFRSDQPCRLFSCGIYRFP